MFAPIQSRIMRRCCPLEFPTNNTSGTESPAWAGLGENKAGSVHCKSSLTGTASWDDSSRAYERDATNTWSYFSYSEKGTSVGWLITHIRFSARGEGSY